MARSSSEHTVLLRNRRARFEYEVVDSIEAGIELHGSEVKSLRAAAASLNEAYATIRDGQVFLIALQISEYPQAHRWNHVPRRDRRLLLHRAEINKLDRQLREKGYTLIPLELYLKNGRIKVLLGVCKGKKQYDRREATKERDAAREIDRERARR